MPATSPRDYAIADEKRQGVENGICQRICMFLWGMMKLAKYPRYTPRPGSNPGPKQPPARSKMELPADVAAGICASATGNEGYADAMRQKNDTKSASLCKIRIYARHQMELPGVNLAGNHRPDSSNQGGGERQRAKNDTKSASPVKIRVYARHQMERHDFQATQGRQTVLSEVRPAGHHFPDSGRSWLWRRSVGKKRHQIGKCI